MPFLVFYARKQFTKFERNQHYRIEEEFGKIADNGDLEQ